MYESKRVGLLEEVPRVMTELEGYVYIRTLWKMKGTTGTLKS